MDPIVQIIYDIVAIIIPVVTAFIVSYIQRKIGTEKMLQIQEELNAKQNLALLAVRFVEQVYTDLHGQDKYNKAAEWLSTQAGKLGLQLSPDEVKGLIEAALRTLKDSFGEEWAKQTNNVNQQQ